jgi:hypothetical protein
LVCAFHDKSYWPYRACYWAVSCKASFGDSNDLGGRTSTANQASLNDRQHTSNDSADEFARKSINKAAQAASSRYESGKPVIITDFSLLTTRQALTLARKTEMQWAN